MHFSSEIQVPLMFLKVFLMLSDMEITGRLAWKRHWRCSSRRNPVTPLAGVCYNTDVFSASSLQPRHQHDRANTSRTLDDVTYGAGLMLCILLQAPNGRGAAGHPPLASCAALKLSTAFCLSWVQRKAKLNLNPNKQALCARTSLSARLKLFFNFSFACFRVGICSH